MKTFVHTKKESLVLGGVILTALALTLSVAELFRWIFGFQSPDAEMTFGKMLSTVMAGAVVVTLVLIPTHWWISRHSVTVDQDHVIVRFDGEEIERRTTSHFLALRASAFDHPKNWMTFQGEPDLVIKGLNGFKLHALARHIDRTKRTDDGVLK